MSLDGMFLIPVTSRCQRRSSCREVEALVVEVAGLDVEDIESSRLRIVGPEVDTMGNVLGT